MKAIGYYNGKMGPLEELSVPMGDRALYFGDGVYDFVFAYNHKLFRMDDHLDRFYNSCRMLEMEFPMSREELEAEIQKCIDATESDEGVYIYWQSSRGVAKRNHIYPGAAKPTLMIMVNPAKPLDYSKPLKLITVEDTRFLHCNIKTLNLIPNVTAAQRAEEAGCQEAILHRGNQLTECAHSSLLILKDGKLIAPELDNLILPSISRKHIYQVAEKLGVPTEVRTVTMDEVWNADEIIVCSTSKLMAAADTIDGKPVGMKDRELFLKLQQEYFREVLDECGWDLNK